MLRNGDVYRGYFFGIYSCYLFCYYFLVTGTHFETAIQNMMEMGFPREQCMNAMRASFNNPDRAVEYLMTVCDNIYPTPTSVPILLVVTQATLVTLGEC
jgi:hypothetical protein